MSETLNLAQTLIARSSVTPDDAGCQSLIAQRLEALGFTIEHLRFGEVDNLWARHGESDKTKTAGPLFVFAGHTDVVPSGPEEQWRFPPFNPTVIDGNLYGRGAADMKGSLAAMVTACERFIAKQPNHRGNIGFLITSDEEGPAQDGTVKVIEHLQAQGETIDWCLVGEPSSTEKIGDVVKNGRRGSLGCLLTVKGVQGHVAYPHLAENPIHTSIPFLAELCATEWDKGNQYFPPTTFQISNIQAGTGASNVIPGELSVLFNFRFSTETTEDELRTKIAALLDKYDLNYRLDWELPGQPFLTEQGELIDAVCSSIKDVCGYDTTLSTAGGTSDGRFIAPTGAQVVELGPLNATIHKVDEHVSIADLDTLSNIYERVLETLLG